jgi:hypothetical protein
MNSLGRPEILELQWKKNKANLALITGDPLTLILSCEPMLILPFQRS